MNARLLPLDCQDMVRPQLNQTETNQGYRSQDPMKNISKEEDIFFDIQRPSTPDSVEDEQDTVEQLRHDQAQAEK